METEDIYISVWNGDIEDIYSSMEWRHRGYIYIAVWNGDIEEIYIYIYIAVWNGDRGYIYI